MNPENRWVKKAKTIPWDAIEEKYAQLFPSKTDMPAKPLRMAPGSLLIQKQLSFSDRELVEELMENPYFQYFIGLRDTRWPPPFVPSLLVEFRKRLTDDVLGEINEMILAFNNHQNARKDYLNLVKCKKRTSKKADPWQTEEKCRNRPKGGIQR